MKNLILTSLLLISYSTAYNQVIKNYQQKSKYHSYIQGAFSYGQFFRMYTGLGDGNFTNHWKSQLGGNLAFGWRRRATSSAKLTFAGQFGTMLHRTRPIRSSLDGFNKLGVFTAIGMESNQEKWKVGIFPWVSYFPGAKFRGDYQFYADRFYNQLWYGLGLTLTTTLNEQLEITSGAYYGRNISDMRYSGVGGGTYGYTRDMPFWLNLGVRYYAWKSN
ncbi:MAG: hypothetical protein AAFZ63_16260 [Bacteroidota bacterium]